MAHVSHRFILLADLHLSGNCAVLIRFANRPPRGHPFFRCITVKLQIASFHSVCNHNGAGMPCLVYVLMRIPWSPRSVRKVWQSI